MTEAMRLLASRVAHDSLCVFRVGTDDGGARDAVCCYHSILDLLRVAAGRQEGGGS